MPAETQPTYTVLSCHFGDVFWIDHLARSLRKFGSDQIKGFVVVDQSREMQRELSQIPGVTDVISFPRDGDQIAQAGHDHAASLDRAIREFHFTTSHIILFDSDAFPTDPVWADNLMDVVLAEVPGSNGELSHPCFMVFPVVAVPEMHFSERFLDRHDNATRFRFDTGRMVAQQLRNAGFEVFMLEPSPGFRGLRGEFYLGGKIYHHGHSSHTHAPKDLRVFISPKTEALWKKKISRGDWELWPMDYVKLGYHYLVRRFFAKLRKVFRSREH